MATKCASKIIDDDLNYSKLRSILSGLANAGEEPDKDKSVVSGMKARLPF